MSNISTIIQLWLILFALTIVITEKFMCNSYCRKTNILDSCMQTPQKANIRILILIIDRQDKSLFAYCCLSIEN